jgi:hypothetical protein
MARALPLSRTSKALLEAAHRRGVRIAYYHFERNQLRLRGEAELGRRGNVRADADFIQLRKLRRGDARACREA